MNRIMDVSDVPACEQHGLADLDPCGKCDARDFTMCAPLTPVEQARMAAIMTTVHLTPHATIMMEGDEATSLYNVTAGTIKLYKLMADGRRQVTGFLFAGDFLGLSTSGRYSYSAETVSEVSLCRFPRQKLDAMLEETPKLERRLLGLAANELMAAQDQMLLLGRKTAAEKMASFLLGLSNRARNRGLLDNPVELAMARNDIADYLGLTTETVSRVITQLKTSGAISLIAGGKVMLRDRDRLLALAGGI